MNNGIKRVHHVGYMIKDISRSIEIFQIMGYSVEKEVFFDEDREAEICFLTMDGTRMELVSPRKGSDLYPLIKKYNNTPYHVCYEVENLSDTAEYLQKKGFLIFRDEQRAQAISPTAKVIFLMHARMGMIELVKLQGEDK